jgi:hypothetical protein
MVNRCRELHHMRFRNNQDMTTPEWMDIHKGKAVIVFIHAGRGHLSRKNLAKHASHSINRLGTLRRCRTGFRRSYAVGSFGCKRPFLGLCACAHVHG